MDLGFETIGNATVICHDRKPVLATDPWLDGPAYFGSWTLSHEIPAEQRAHVAACDYLWISHGHPDHLCPATLEKLRGKTILLPDHFGIGGGRIQRELADQGHTLSVLRDGEWVRLSERLRVCSVADYNQDAALLIDLGGHLIVDANDVSDRGGGRFLRELARRYASSFLLCLTGYGDADMINVFDESGARIAPAAAAKEPVGPGIAGLLEHFGLKRFVPFSAMHKYQRADSVWANEYTTEPEDCARLFPAGRHELLPAFARVDLASLAWRSIDPPRAQPRALAPETFGDSWSEQLERGDVEKLAAYFGRFEHLRTFLGWIRFRVGGRDHVLDLEREHAARGIGFEVPRASLMKAVEWEVFDDLLIGNFMRTTLHGPWPEHGAGGLYPDFTPFVTKYGDNGRAFSRAELRQYFQAYRSRGHFEPPPGAEQRAVSAYL
jgi:hypothetical protein